MRLRVLRSAYFYFINIDINCLLRDTKSSPNHNSPETSYVCAGDYTKTVENCNRQTGFSSLAKVRLQSKFSLFVSFATIGVNFLMIPLYQDLWDHVFLLLIFIDFRARIHFPFSWTLFLERLKGTQHTADLARSSVDDSQSRQLTTSQDVVPD